MALRIEVMSWRMDVITKESAVHVLEVEYVGPRSKRETILPLPTVPLVLEHCELVGQSPSLLRNLVWRPVTHHVMNQCFWSSRTMTGERSMHTPDKFGRIKYLYACLSDWVIT